MITTALLMRDAPLEEKRAFATHAASHAAAYVGIAAADVWRRARAPELVRARRLAWSVLADGGITAAEIARFWGYNHSSVLYALACARTDAEHARDARAFGRRASVRLLTRGPYSLEIALLDLLATIPASARRPVGCYVLGDLLGYRKQAGGVLDRYQGYRLLADNPRLADHLHRLLLTHEEWGAAAVLLHRCRPSGGVPRQ